MALTGADFYTGWAAGLFFPIKVVLLLSLLYLDSTDGCLTGFDGKAGLAASFALDLERPLSATAGFRTDDELFFRRGEAAFFSGTGTVLTGLGLGSGLTAGLACLGADFDLEILSDTVGRAAALGSAVLGFD